MLKMLGKLIGRSKKIDNRELYGLDNLDDDAIGYPPNPIGIPVVQTRVLLERMQVEVNKIKHEIGIDRHVFDEFVLPVFERFIRYADLLPASEYKHHSTGGGLIAHSVDVAHRCMRAAQMTHFPVSTGSLTETQQSNMQWRVATILAGLLHDSGKILADVKVHNGNPIISERIVWDAQSGGSIHDWAADNKIDRYFVSWNRDRHMKHQNASLVMMERLIPTKTRTWLEKCYDGREIHAMMLASVGNNNMSHPMQQIVAEADSKSVKADMFSRNSHITKEIKRVPLSELFCDLIKHYLLTNKWKVNEKNAYVWFVDEKLYIVWSNAVQELVEEMVGAGYKIPSSPEVLARLMIEEGMAVENGEEMFFDIYPEILGDAKKPVKIKALKVRNIQRVVLEPEKLYSLKEHDKRPSKPEAEPAPANEIDSIESADQAIIEEIFQDDAELERQYMRSNRGHETAQFTLSRVANNIKLAMIERNKARQIIHETTATEAAIEPPESLTLKPEEYVQHEQESHEVQHEECVFDESESVVQDETTDTTKSKNSTPYSKEEPPKEMSEIAQFIQLNFDFDSTDGEIQIPSTSILDIVLLAKTQGYKWSVVDIEDAEGVVINE
ncbi:MobH family relaxase [Vibrio cholerae]